MITLASTLFKLVGKIAIDMDEATTGINSTVRAAKDAETPFQTALNKLGTIAKGAGATIAAGLGTATVALGNMLKEALNLSGQVEQGMGGAEAVFGEYATKIQSHARNAYASMGLSVADYYNTANKMGSLFKGTGADVEDAYEMTTSAMQRAADVASLMGIDMNWAMESVAGMAKGNFTMMDNLGVAMNETTLKAYALEKGIEGTWDEMTQAQKIGIAYEMFMERTAYAMGQYTKENDTYSGSLNTAKAAWKNFLSGEMSIEEAIPHFEAAGQVIIDRITKLLPHLVTGLTTLLSALTPYIGDIVEALAPVVIPAMKDLLVAIIKSLPDIIVACADALYDAFTVLMDTIGLGFLLPDKERHEAYIGQAEANQAAEAAEKDMSARYEAWNESQRDAALDYIYLRKQGYNDSELSDEIDALMAAGITGEILNVFMAKVSDEIAIGNLKNDGDASMPYAESWFRHDDGIKDSVLPELGQNSALLPRMMNTPLFGNGSGGNGIATLETIMANQLAVLQQIASNGNRPIYLNTGALVGGLLPGINAGLGQIVNRGNA